jgi:Ca-activated chloride channel homolog
MTTAWLLAACAAGSATAAQRPPVFRAEIGVVVLQATVHNRRGETMPGLPREAFTVYENGRRQAITIFRQGDAPLSLGLLLDNSRSMRGKREAAEAAALAVVRASRREDETFVMNFADKARVDVPLTADPDALTAGVVRRDSIGGTALRDAIAQAVEHLAAHATRTRRVLLVISDGNDNASLLDAEAVKRAALDRDVALFAIGIASREESDAARRGRDALEELTESTGGTTLQAWNGVEADALGREAALRMRHFYTIGYAPLDQALDGTYRKLRLVAKGQEPVRVRTRAGYRAARSAGR